MEANNWLVDGHIYVGREIILIDVVKACTHYCDNACGGIIYISKANLVEISLIMDEILIFLTLILTYLFKVGEMTHLCCQSQLQHFKKDWLKSVT